VKLAHFFPQIFPADAEQAGGFGPVSLACQECLLDKALFGKSQLVAQAKTPGLHFLLPIFGDAGKDIDIDISAGLDGTDTELYAERFRKGQAIVAAGFAPEKIRMIKPGVESFGP